MRSGGTHFRRWSPVRGAKHFRGRTGNLDRLRCRPAGTERLLLRPAIGPSTWYRSSWSTRRRGFGDYAPIAVLSHEWGHHIQTLLGVVGPTRKDFELQADCLTGVFTRYADEQALLDYGDFLEALNSAIDAGDEVFLPEDFPGAHGMAEDRVKALTKGLLLFGFLVLPALAARPLVNRMSSFLWLSSVLGLAMALFGFYSSVRLDLPLGPTDVALGCCLIFLAYALRRLSRNGHWG